MAIKLGDNGKTNFYFDIRNFFLDRFDTNGSGIGDALWRTALIWIATGNDLIGDAVKSCIVLVKGKYRFVRHPNNNENTCSRDQAIPTMVALKMYDKEFYRVVVDNLDFRISKGLITGTWWDCWFWVKENYLAWRIISFYKFLFASSDTAYSKHLFCLMIWSSGQKMLLLRKKMISIIPKENYFCRALLGDTFTSSDIDAILKEMPRVDYIWQREFPSDPVSHRLTTAIESTHNNFHLEMLNFILVRDYGLDIVTV